jgi:AAA15 family ATPase/GTPase
MRRVIRMGGSMKLVAFRILNCFGFHDSGWINLLDPQNLIYVLGRNSSGKSSFLTAIAYFAEGLTPSEADNFENFDGTKQASTLQARFTLHGDELSLDDFMEGVQKRLTEHGITPDIVRINEAAGFLVKDIRRIYHEILSRANTNREVWVEKTSEGNYRILIDRDFNDYNARIKNVKAVIDTAIPGGNINMRGANHRISLGFYDFENRIAPQLPKIELFEENYSLIEPLPRSITLKLMDQNTNVEERNKILAAFIQVLGEKQLRQFLTSNNPFTKQKLRDEMQANVNQLTERLNRSLFGAETDDPDLLNIILFPGDGLTITIQTSTKPSFYENISDNTKLLFAYFLYQETHGIEGDILLFDEPNNGFHPSAQKNLLTFLKIIAENKLVIVSTHSEHLIDTDNLSGVRIMGVDDNKALLVLDGFTKHGRSLKGHSDYLAYQPILDAIGFKVASQLNIRDKVMITEGITDLYYLKAFKKILKHGGDLNIAPARGDSTILNLIPLLISQGIRFRILIDEGELRQIIQQSWNVDDEFIHEISIPSPYMGKMTTAGIEDLFTKDDYRKLLSRINHIASAEFDYISNSAYAKKNAVKTLAAFDIYRNVRNYKETDFDPQTVAAFREVLEFSQGKTWYSIS